MSDEMKDKIREYVVDEYVEEDSGVTVEDDTPLISGGLVDSFSMVSLKLFLETEYNITIPDDKATADAFDNVNAIAALVREFTDA
jgi:acyl carrier protein